MGVRDRRGGRERRRRRRKGGEGRERTTIRTPCRKFLATPLALYPPPHRLGVNALTNKSNK